MSLFNEFDFRKLSLINFDELIACQGEELPGIRFSEHFGLINLPKTHDCVDVNCAGVMTKERRAELKLKFRYHCNKCNTVINAAQYTWFSNSRLSIMISLKLIYFWVSKCTVDFTSMALGLAKSTVVNHFGQLREMCINKCSFNSNQIGGEGHEVEVDETKVFHRKNHRGRLTFSEKKSHG